MWASAPTLLMLGDCMNAKIDVTNIRIETPRLILRPWEKVDLQDLFEYASVPGVGEMAGWTHHESMEESDGILDMFIAEKKTFAVICKDNNKVIGSLGIENVKEEPEISHELFGREIGYVLSKDYWGKGLMAEAVKAVIEYCFTILRYDYLTCAHFVQNNQSRRVIEKSGFHYLKDVKHETRYGTVEDTKLYICYNPNSEVKNV
jgi:ribosomal-protein-alanine N-acetyltransferase